MSSSSQFNLSLDRTGQDWILSAQLVSRTDKLLLLLRLDRVPLPHLVIIIIAIHSVPFVALPIHSTVYRQAEQQQQHTSHLIAYPHDTATDRHQQVRQKGMEGQTEPGFTSATNKL